MTGGIYNGWYASNVTSSYVSYGCSSATTTYSTSTWTSYVRYEGGDSTADNDGSGIQGIVSYGSVGEWIYAAAVKETQEQKAARLEKERKEAEEARLADRRARRLFVRVAGLSFYKTLRRKGHIDVIGESKIRYRLAVGHMVRVMEGNFGDKVSHKLCAYVPGVPQFDTLVAQYLCLVSGVSEEEEFKKVAIKHAA